MHITHIPHSTYHIAHSTYHIVLSTLMGTAYTIIACIPHCLHHHCMHTTLKAQSTSTKHISGHCLLEHASCALGGGIGIRRAPLLFSLPFSFSLPSCQKPQKKRAKEIKMPRVHPRGRLFWTLACVWRDTFGCRWYLRSC